MPFSFKYFSILLLFTFSCNTYKVATRYTNKKLSKNGLEFKEFKNEKYSISYWDSGGNKPVLILIHGFGASTEFQWYKQVEDLKKAYRLILPNLIYFGGSTSTLQITSVSDQTNAMQALIDHLAIVTFSLCGVSYGGLIASELALSNPEKVKKWYNSKK